MTGPNDEGRLRVRVADAPRADGYASTGKGGRTLADAYCFVVGYTRRRKDP